MRHLAALLCLLVWASPVSAAVVQICGFETGDATEAVSTNGTFDAGYTAVKRTGAYALRVNPTTTAAGSVEFRRGSLANLGNSVFVRIYFRYATKPAANHEPILTIINTVGALKFELRINSSGNLLGYDSGVAAITDGTGAAATLAQDTWYRIEVNLNEVGAGDTDTVTVKVDGVDDITGTDDFGANEVLGVWPGKRTNRSGQTVDFFYDDISIDTANYPGAGQVSIMRPDGDGNVTVWTVGAGAGADWTNIEEVPNDGDTTYLLSTLTINEASTVTLESASSAGITGTIAAVKAVAVMKRDGAGNGTAWVRIRAGGTDSDAGSFTIGSTYNAAGANVRDTDPSDSTAWTLSDLESLEVGVKEGEVTDRTRATAIYAMVDYVPGAASNRRCLGLLGVSCGP